MSTFHRTREPEGVAVLRIALLISALSVCPITVFGADSNGGEPRRHGPAWEWPLEARLAQRFDNARIAERARAYQLAHGPRAATHDTESSGPATSYVIDGRRNPELFLPHELFESLLSGVVTDEPLRSRQRDYYRPAIRQFGFDDVAFWGQLEAATAPLTGLIRSGSATADELCAERYQALQAARAVFGRELFGRFLYVVIAPSRQYGSTTNVADPAAQLRRAAEGCPR